MLYLAATFGQNIRSWNMGAVTRMARWVLGVESPPYSADPSGSLSRTEAPTHGCQKRPAPCADVYSWNFRLVHAGG
jgi:hypothetical protein